MGRCSWNDFMCRLMFDFVFPGVFRQVQEMTNMVSCQQMKF